MSNPNLDPGAENPAVDKEFENSIRPESLEDFAGQPQAIENVKIFIKVENDSGFRRHGLDLILEKTVSLKEALCGFTFELKYITGKVYTITNNSGNIISNGYKKLIPAMGLERDGHKGNLVIIFDVKFPEKITAETIEAIKALDF